jgi:protein-disulfide isomerase
MWCSHRLHFWRAQISGLQPFVWLGFTWGFRLRLVYRRACGVQKQRLSQGFSPIARRWGGGAATWIYHRSKWLGQLTFRLCDNQRIVLNLRAFALLLVAGSLPSLGCHAQVPAPVAGKPLPAALAWRVEVLLRQKAQLPPESTITVGPATPSELPGYSTVAVTVVSDGKMSHPINFLVSDDGKALAQFNKYDISADPRTSFSDAGRPARGGPESAPVVIVGFDDLECPYCARLHATIFPAITKRYGDKVRIVYKDDPLIEIHPWAMRAAVDVNCLGAQSADGYWHLVDTIHAHAGEIGKQIAAAPPTGPLPSDAAAKTDAPDKTLARANDQLDELTKTEGKNVKADPTVLNACLAKQDTTAIDATRKLATGLGIESTPTLFINGDKTDGAVPIEFLFGLIDNALRAENVTPPPPYVAPGPAVPEAAPAGKPNGGK